MKNHYPLYVKSAAGSRMYVPMECKAQGDTGAFSGYASIFGNVDLGGDVITKDAPFKEMVTDAEGKVVVLFQHDSGGGFGSTGSGGLPIGKATVEQNSKGLKFDGQLVTEDPFCQRVLAHMKAGTLRGMSIGYDIMAGGAKLLDSGVRELNALKLWEISVVTFGMNPKASVDTVKNAVQKCTSVRELEAVLRDAAGLSKTQASRHAGEIWKTLSGQRDADEDESATLSRMVETLNRIGQSAAG